MTERRDLRGRAETGSRRAGLPALLAVLRAGLPALLAVLRAGLPALLAVLRAGLPALLVVLTLILLPAAAQGSFQVGLQDPLLDGSATPAQSAAGYAVMSEVGGSVVRLSAFWSDIAPNKPAAPSDPADPAYQWSSLDSAVRNAAAHHVSPLLTLSTAPLWAQGANRPNNSFLGVGAWDPSPTELGRFAHAVAQRYSGHFPDPVIAGQNLPRVKYLEIWNEENLPAFLGAPKLSAEYHSMLSDAYHAIKSVDSSDQVVMGGFAPVSYKPGTTVSPLKLAAEMMCLRHSGTRFTRLGHCSPAPFDILAEHPYSLDVTPTQPAGSYDDVLVADVHKLRDLLNAAARLHTVRGGPHPLWFDEWGWVTRPPDSRYGDSFTTAARYVAYSMYEMWRAGGSLVIWQGIHDGGEGLLAAAGLETKSGRAKPSLNAFAFPFIASAGNQRGFAWGRAPVSGRVRVAVQRRTGRRWHTVAHAETGRDGVFTVHFPASGNATYRAQAPSVTSLAYYSASIPGRRTH